MADTCYIARFKDGSETRHRTACFSQFLDNYNPHPNLQAISLNHEYNGKVYKHPEFLKLVSEAFPDGLVSKDGWVTYEGYPGDLVAYAAITLRHPGEYQYADLLPEMMKTIESEYEKILKPVFKLTGPLKCVLLNIPNRGYKDAISLFASDGHCAVDWSAMSLTDLFYLSSIKTFSGVQKIIGEGGKYGWTRGYSYSVPRRNKKGGYGDGGDKKLQGLLTNLRGKGGSYDPLTYGYTYQQVSPKDVYSRIFQLMQENPE